MGSGIPAADPWGYGPGRQHALYARGAPRCGMFCHFVLTQTSVFLRFREIAEKKITSIVVGLPLTLKGSYSKQTEIVLDFIEQLKADLKIPILTVDERLSSIAAEKSLQEQSVKTGYEKGRVDETAAAIILQEYLDSHS